MESVNNKDLHRAESVNGILESIEIDKMADVSLIEDEIMGPIQKFTNQKSLEKKASLTRKRNQIQGNGPRMGRMNSGAVQGLQGLRFLDRTTTGKEGDPWKVVEKRFNQHALDNMLFKDKFGACIGIFFILNFR